MSALPTAVQWSHVMLGPRLRAGDVVAPVAKERARKMVADCLELNADKASPNWLLVDKTAASVRVNNLPAREDVRFQDIQEQFIVEICSK